MSKKIIWKIWYVYKPLLLAKFFYGLAKLCELLLSQIKKLEHTPDSQIKLFFKLAIYALLFGAFMVVWFMGYEAMCNTFNTSIFCSTF